MKAEKPSYLDFEKQSYVWKLDIDYRNHPEQYHVGKGEQGVLICAPYKSEIGRYWRFKTEAIAKESSAKIYELFLEYFSAGDFVGGVFLSIFIGVNLYCHLYVDLSLLRSLLLAS
jgi:hypothetical protein